jgi:hypothetical protein
MAYNFAAFASLRELFILDGNTLGRLLIAAGSQTIYT